jgi:hypothetical protein
LQAAHGAWHRPARLLCATLVLFPLGLNYPALDRSRDYAVEDYARNVLRSMDSGAVLFSSEYWLIASPAYYQQLVEGVRPDVAVLDVGLLGGHWYYDQLEARYPWLIRDSRKEIDAYRVELDKHMRGVVDTGVHNNRLLEMFRSFISQSRAQGRAVYVSQGINSTMLGGYERVPSGMVS